jgi:hypothetical protein
MFEIAVVITQIAILIFVVTSMLAMGLMPIGGELGKRAQVAAGNEMMPDKGQTDMN